MTRNALAKSKHRRIGFLQRLLLLLGASPLFAGSQTITTVAGGTGGGASPTSVSLDIPHDVTLSPTGDIYVADTYNNVVRKISANGVASVIAGNGAEGYAGDGGPAILAELSQPWGVAADTAGNVYIADAHNNRIRRVDTSGQITTVAGNGSVFFSGDGGPATEAQLSAPLDVVIDHSGNLIIADSGNSRIRKVDPSGTISTIAGNGIYGLSGDGGPATSAQLAGAGGVAADSAGNVYIADSNNGRVRKVDLDGMISTVAGGGMPFDGVGDGGQATDAGLASPTGVSVDTSGNLFIAESGKNVVRRVTPAGLITTIIGQSYVANDGYCYVLPGMTCFAGDNGPASSAKFYTLYSVTLDDLGRVFITDAGNNRIRYVANGIVTTIVGNGTQSFSGDGGSGTAAQLYEPAGLALDVGGDLYIADDKNHVVRKLSSNGSITTVAGIGPGPSNVFSGGFSGDHGPATSAELNGPTGVAKDATGNLYIADTRNNVVRKVDIGGTITTVAGTGQGGYDGDSGPADQAKLYGPMGLAFDSDQNLYIADTSNGVVRRVSASGTITTVAGGGSPSSGIGDGGLATSATMGPVAVALDSANNLYIADFGNARVRKVDALGVISTVAGNGDIGGYGDGGPATSAAIWGPRGVTVDAGGNIFVTAKEDFVVRRITPAGTISTIAGNGRTFGFSGDGGPATAAQMMFPWGIVVGNAGKLYMADSGNRRVRFLTITDLFDNGFE